MTGNISRFNFRYLIIEGVIVSVGGGGDIVVEMHRLWSAMVGIMENVLNNLR